MVYGVGCDLGVGAEAEPVGETRRQRDHVLQRPAQLYPCFQKTTKMSAFTPKVDEFVNFQSKIDEFDNFHYKSGQCDHVLQRPGARPLFPSEGFRSAAVFNGGCRVSGVGCTVSGVECRVWA